MTDLPLVRAPRVPVTDTASGHLTGSLDQSIDEATDLHAFLFDQLGLGYRPTGLA